MNKSPEEQAKALEQHLLDEEVRTMVRGARAAGISMEECQKTLARALYKEMPPGSPKGPVVRQAKDMIKEIYEEPESEQ